MTVSSDVCADNPQINPVYVAIVMLALEYKVYQQQFYISLGNLETANTKLHKYQDLY